MFRGFRIKVCNFASLIEDSEQIIWMLLQVPDDVIAQLVLLTMLNPEEYGMVLYMH